MNLDDYGQDTVNELLEKYKDYNEKSIFKFKNVIKNYKEHSIFCQANKVLFGYSGVDDMVKGVQPSEVCYIVSPTDSGKTSYAFNIIKNNLNAETIIPYFNLENNEYQSFERMVQLETGTPFWETQDRFIKDDKEFISKCEELSLKWDSCITIVRRIGLNEIVPYCKVCEEISGKKIKFVLIDYVQLVKLMQSNEYTRISEIAQTIKEIGLMLRIPIIVLSQTARQNVKAGLDLYSAKGSGEIENSAQIYFTLEVLNEMPINMNDNNLLELINKNNEQKSDFIPLIMKPHKLKRATKKNVILLLEKKTLRIIEYGKEPVIVEQEDMPF